jgi:hypothetical protein
LSSLTIVSFRHSTTLKHAYIKYIFQVYPARHKKATVLYNKFEISYFFMKSAEKGSKNIEGEK